VVYRVDRPRVDGGEDNVAAKVTATDGDESTKLQARQEYELLKQISHPNILRAHALEEAASEIAMITEFVPGGSLAACVRQEGALPLAWAHQVASGLVVAVKHLHEQRVFHLDINPNNVLLREDGSPVLCDFGSAERAREALCPGALTTPLYAAPEAVANAASSGELLDVWGAGCCIWEATLGALPWTLDLSDSWTVDKAAFIQRLEKFAEVEIPARKEGASIVLQTVRRPDLPDECWNLLQRCLAPQQTRATALEAAENAWIKEFTCPQELTSEELWMRRHNPYVGTVWRAPSSPSMFSPDPDSPRVVAPTRRQRRKRCCWMDSPDSPKNVAASRVHKIGDRPLSAEEDVTKDVASLATASLETIILGDRSIPSTEIQTDSTDDDGPFVSRLRPHANSPARSKSFPDTRSDLRTPEHLLVYPSRPTYPITSLDFETAPAA
jgi:serine/threonine protein kinase